MSDQFLPFWELKWMDMMMNQWCLTWPSNAEHLEFGGTLFSERIFTVSSCAGGLFYRRTAIGSYAELPGLDRLCNGSMSVTLRLFVTEWTLAIRICTKRTAASWPQHAALEPASCSLPAKKILHGQNKPCSWPSIFAWPTECSWIQKHWIAPRKWDCSPTVSVEPSIPCTSLGYEA